MLDAFNGARLETLRHLYGLSQSELGLRLGIAQSRLSRIERGDLALPAELAAAASEQFGEPLAFFHVPSGAVPLGPAAFRRKASTKAVERDRISTLYAEAARSFAAVSEASGYREFDAPDVLSSPEHIAAEVRLAQGLTPTQPIRNVTRLIERLGIGVVAELDEPQHAHDGADAAGITMPTVHNRRPLIATMSIGRGDVQRLTLAHELGHMILDRRAAIINCSSRSPQERAAFAFASALLIPPEIVARRITETSTLRHYVELKSEFGMSASAIIMAARRTGAITETRARTLQIQHSSRGWRHEEPVDVELEKPMLVQQALAKAYPSATFARASHALGIAPARLRRWSGAQVENESEGTVTAFRRNRR
jgi:Zn-dependent peptidase ImmA (M78 family)/transcriptional regulator with XRE-family HTH domain